MWKIDKSYTSWYVQEEGSWGETRQERYRYNKIQILMYQKIINIINRLGKSIKRRIDWSEKKGGDIKE